MPMLAALSAAHLAAILFPRTLRRLYIVRDNDPAGDGAMAELVDRTRTAGIEAVALSPCCDDFNDDVSRFVIKARVVRHRGHQFRSATLTKHVIYLERDGVSRDGADARLFDAKSDVATGARLPSDVRTIATTSASSFRPRMHPTCRIFGRLLAN